MHYLCQMYKYNDKELGIVIIKPDIRAKRIIARRKDGHFVLTVPYGFNSKKIKSVLDEMRPRLIKLNPIKNQLITDDSVIETFSFTARLSRANLIDAVKITLKNNELTVFIPENFNLESPDSQHIVKEMIRHALRHEAKRILPKKTMEFAQKLNIEVANVKINRSVSRWGSCSHKKSINFSFYLMLFPEKYIDYVILHELAHTIEMNHSEKFWKLLSEFCGEDARALSKAMKKDTPEIYSLLAN